MLASGLSLTPRAIFSPLRNARLVLAALALNFLVSPAFAVMLTILIPLERPHAIGFLLLSGAAGAPFLPKLVENAHCDVGFAVALMTLLTIGTTLFMPFALPLIVADQPKGKTADREIEKTSRRRSSAGFPSATGPRRPTRKMIGKSFSRKTSSAQWSPAKWRGWNIFNA
jgi:Sodium Bile acid symporter family